MIKYELINSYVCKVSYE